jgi:hypothetical protein
MGIPHKAIDEGEKVFVVPLDKLGKGINITALDTSDYDIVIHWYSGVFIHTQ